MSELVTPSNQLTTAPDFMGEEVGQGTEQLGNYYIPPYLKVVQKQAENALLEKFNIGYVVAIQSPNEPTLLWDSKEASEPILFTPLFFFVEYATWLPYELKGQDSTILDRSFDPDSEVAKKSRNKATWSEQYKDTGENVRHCEHLCFIIRIWNANFDDPCVLTFLRGSHKAGRNFANLAKSRRLQNGSVAPLYGCRYQLTTTDASNMKQQEYKVPVVDNPMSEPFVTDPNLYAQLKESHQALKELYESKQIQVNYEEESEGEKEELRF